MCLRRRKIAGFFAINVYLIVLRPDHPVNRKGVDLARPAGQKDSGICLFPSLDAGLTGMCIPGLSLKKKIIGVGD